MKIRVDTFLGGISPKVSARLLRPDQAQIAKNLALHSGSLKPLNTLSNVSATLKAGTIKTIHLFANQYWWNWTETVNVVRGPIAGDTSERTYWTGDSADSGMPKMGYSPYSVTAAPYPTAYYRLGVPVPVLAPSLALGGGGGCDVANQASRAYVYTYVSALGEEGPPSAATVIDNVCPGQTISITGLSGAPTGPYNIATKRIYRSVTGSDGDYDYLLVDEIAVANTTYSDTKTDAQLIGSPLESTDWDAPVAGLVGLTELSNGMMAGFSGKDVWICEPFQPHAWPHRQTVAYPVVAVAGFGTTMIALTEGTPYIASGSDPTALTLEKLAFSQACVSARGVAIAGDAGVIYPSPDGLVFVGAGGERIMTENIMRRAEWQAYKPESIHGYFHDGVYIGFYDTGSVTGGFIFDPKEDSFTNIDTYATAGHVDIKTDALYLIVSGQLQKWQGGSTKQTYTWKSKVFETEYTNFGFGRVTAASYGSMTLKVYGDGTLRHTQTVTSGSPFRLPSGFLCRNWELEIASNDEVYSVEIAHSASEFN